VEKEIIIGEINNFAEKLFKNKIFSNYIGCIPKKNLLTNIDV